jgi:hypothetical protein
MYARCPDCRCTRLLIVRKGNRGTVVTFRLHHERWPDADLHERHHNPLCRGSGRTLPLGSSLSKL